MRIIKPSFLLFFLPLLLQLFLTSCTTTQKKQKEPRRPQARLDLAGNQIKEKLFFAGFVASGYDQTSSNESLEGWLEKNLKYGQHIINLPGKGNKDSNESLNQFYSTAWDNFSHPEFDVSTQLASSKPKAFVFSIDGEHISTETIDGTDYLIVDLTGQIIVFDWKDRLILASYPLILSAKDIYNPDPEWIRKQMTALYYDGWGKNPVGFLDYFVKFMRERVSLTFYYDGHTVNKAGIENITIGPKALPFIKKAGESVGNYKQKLAQRFTTYLAKNQNLAIVPYGFPDENGERKLSIVPGGGAMSDKFADNSANELIIPKADFPIDLSLTSLKEVEISKSRIDKVLAYGAFTKFTVNDSLRSTILFEDKFKKIKTRHLPIDMNPDPWRWLDAQVVNLIDEITKNLDNPDSKWCDAQSNGKSTRKNLQKLYKNQLSTCLSPLPSN